MRDFRVWWALFVFFGALCVVVLQWGYRGLARAREAVASRSGPERPALDRRIRREGWRLACMTLSVVATTALLFAALLGAPAAAILILRLVAVAAVAAVLWLSVSR